MRNFFIIIFFNSFIGFTQQDSLKCMNLYDDKQYEESYECFQSSPNSPLDYYMCAMLSRHLEKIDEFQEWNEASLKRFKNEPLSYYYVSYLLGDSTNESLKVIERGAKKFPEDSLMLTSLINVYIVRDEKKKALEIANTLTELKPNVLIYEVTRGTILQNLNRQAEAVISFTKCLKLDNQNYTANYGLGSIYYNWAADKFALSNEEEDPEVYKKLEAEAQKMMEKALPFLEKTYLSDNKDTTTIKALKTCYMKLGMMDQYRALMDDQAK
ncbi:MAG: tetratricopeptide (TPR) repeat protein [Arenicella sp.]|jgi:tetratricopeptide (TPR) repeat protein